MKLKERICQEKAIHTAYINKFDPVMNLFISSQRILIIKPKPFPSLIFIVIIGLATLSQEMGSSFFQNGKESGEFT